METTSVFPEVTHQEPSTTSLLPTILHPFLKWVGGKTKFISEICPFIPNRYERYYEPFIGGGSLFFYLQPSKAYISDINIELINCYQVIRANVTGLISNLESKNNTSEDVYYEYRQKFNKLKKEYDFSYEDVLLDGSLSEEESDVLKCVCIEKASLFIFMNKTCFRGIYRENQKGQMNVPYGNYKSPTIYDKKNLIDISKYLTTSDIQIKHHSYKMITPSRTDFVYFDPPYDQEKSTDFVSYTKDVFNQKELFEFIKEGSYKFVLSNSPTNNIKTLYKDYSQKILTGKRSVDVKKIKTVKDIEIIISTKETIV